MSLRAWPPCRLHYTHPLALLTATIPAPSRPLADTGFTVPLSSKVTEVEVVCNATLGEGWFYEGGGLYRPVHLVQTTDRLRLAHQGVSVRTKIAEDFAAPPPATPLQQTVVPGIECAPETDRGGGGRCRAGSAEVSVSVEVANGRDAPASFRVLAKLYRRGGRRRGGRCDGVDGRTCGGRRARQHHPPCSCP